MSHFDAHNFGTNLLFNLLPHQAPAWSVFGSCSEQRGTNSSFHFISFHFENYSVVYKWHSCLCADPVCIYIYIYIYVCVCMSLFSNDECSALIIVPFFVVVHLISYFTKSSMTFVCTIFPNDDNCPIVALCLHVCMAMRQCVLLFLHNVSMIHLWAL